VNPLAISTYTIPQAIEVFVYGFCNGKSRTYPYVATKLESVWIMQDSPARKSARKSEIVTHGIEPERVIQIVRKSGVGWHFLCDIHEPDADFTSIRSTYKSLGYRAISTEWLFVHNLQKIPKFESEPQAREIRDDATLDSIYQRAKQKRKILTDTQLFGVWDDQQDIGWVRSIPHGTAAWVSDLYVYESHRGMGYGRALMSKLLKHERKQGLEQSVLLASSDGARLYPHLGYERIGVLQMFCPGFEDLAPSPTTGSFKLAGRLRGATVNIYAIFIADFVIDGVGVRDRTPLV
jgi:GNAT superfamily N-acetyltransferase